MENAKSGVFLQLGMTLGIHPHRQDITYMNSESPAGQHSSDNYRTFQISQRLLKPSSFLSVQVGGREVGQVQMEHCAGIEAPGKSQPLTPKDPQAFRGAL